jgi:hypothetical protein
VLCWPAKTDLEKGNCVIQYRIQNILLTVIALLLFVNLVGTFTPPVHAVGKAQYKAVMPSQNGFQPGVQQALEEQSAQGWEYVNSNASNVMIFKK